MDKDDVVVGILLLLGAVGVGTAGYGVGRDYAREKYSPKTVYVRELNDDGKPDLVVTTKSGTKFLYLQQEDGTYRKLEEYMDAKVKDLESKAKDSE